MASKIIRIMFMSIGISLFGAGVLGAIATLIVTTLFTPSTYQLGDLTDVLVLQVISMIIGIIFIILSTLFHK